MRISHLKSKIIVPVQQKFGGRALWSILDQALVSGVNLLTGILLVRTLGLRDFGNYALITVVAQSIAVLQLAAVISPLMTLFEQRGPISRGSYLTAVGMQQLAYLIIITFCIIVTWSLVPDALTNASIGVYAAISFFTSSQLQEFSRRILFASGRTRLAFLCDLIAYGGRLTILSYLAFQTILDIETTWWTIASLNVTSFLLIVPDLARSKPIWAEVISISRRHIELARWLFGTAASQWLSGNLLLILIGSILGVEALGTVRAIQNLIGPINLIVQSLENFMPSAASQILATSPPAGLRRYINGSAIIGTSIFAVGILLSMPLLPYIVDLLYRRQFPSQEVVWLALGLYATSGFVAAVFMAGLRALGELKTTFLFQLASGIVCLPIGWLAATYFGLSGAMSVYLGQRMLTAVQIAIVFIKKTRLQ